MKKGLARGVRIPLVHGLVASSLALSMLASGPVRAQSTAVDLSAASTLSIAVPVAASVAAPVLLVSGAATLTVVSVVVTAEAVIWVVERASDGARMSIRWAGDGLAAASTVVGSVVVVTAVSTGWLVSQAGKVVAFIPNEIGASLTHHERITERGFERGVR